MKTINCFFILMSGIFLLSACRSDPERSRESRSADAETKNHTKTLVPPWTVELNDSTQMMEIRKNPAADMTNLTPEDIVDALNIKYPRIKLEWIKQEGDTAFVKIDDASYLTQQSGSEGAQAYLAEATFSLTELKGIEAVDFSFKEGDHGAPGRYSRENFRNFN